jgi:hypothetical protein
MCVCECARPQCPLNHPYHKTCITKECVLSRMSVRVCASVCVQVSKRACVCVCACVCMNLHVHVQMSRCEIL